MIKLTDLLEDKSTQDADKWVRVSTKRTRL